MSRERFLVMVPTYNEMENLPRKVPKVLAQDERIEILVIDDASPDGTGALVCDPSVFTCIDPSQTEGATCENAFVINHVPYDHEGDTSLMSNSFSTEADACPGYATAVGATPSDAVYKFTPDVTAAANTVTNCT